MYIEYLLYFRGFFFFNWTNALILLLELICQKRRNVNRIGGGGGGPKGVCNINSAYFMHIMTKIGGGGQGSLCPPPPPPPPGSYAYATKGNVHAHVYDSSYY